MALTVAQLVDGLIKTMRCVFITAVVVFVGAQIGISSSSRAPAVLTVPPLLRPSIPSEPPVQHTSELTNDEDPPVHHASPPSSRFTEVPRITVSPEAHSEESPAAHHPKLKHTHNIYQRKWDAAPIVLEQEKLVFFSVPKVACTVFKQLFRRMMGLKDWRVGNDLIPHNFKSNGLRYLFHWPLDEAQAIMTDPAWKKVIFLREPHERYLSAYLDKGKASIQKYGPGGFMKLRCGEYVSSFKEFMNLTARCRDNHWVPQVERVDAVWWPYVDFFGDMRDDVAGLVRKMLSPEAWDTYAADGWGKHGNESIFKSNAMLTRRTGAAERMSKMWTEENLEIFDKRFAADLKWFKAIKWTRVRDNEGLGTPPY
eukprot:TRINITY_DN50561_c0_g1_i1.p1 TRINITY_DN50561_c0_g1~~TRINITY_DN50561_c0_g1_i1.p1  ORF type:complete len:368 (+),score=78.65 TRINITY_DN50561_c0_g1_i1:128-1231(+)